MELSDVQRKQLGRLWMVYGNNGRLHSHSNHRFIQDLLEVGEDLRVNGSPHSKLISKDCSEDVSKVLNGAFDFDKFKRTMADKIAQP